MNKLRQGDYVELLAGKDKGKKGNILKIAKDRVVVEGVNMLKKHVKANPQQNIPGAIKSIEGSVHISNVMLVNAGTEKRSKVGIKVLEDGKKVRYYKDNGEVVEAVS